MGEKSGSNGRINLVSSQPDADVVRQQEIAEVGRC